MTRRSWLRRARVRALKHACVDVLRQTGSDAAREALRTAETKGDRLLRAAARAALAHTAPPPDATAPRADRVPAIVKQGVG